ncbi:MAG: beta-propeller domain-containing protein [Nanoarchaeota archaeon]|nr:beta-propeller domain-containing protein [Nanoarchaeota archaeon]
MRGTITVGVIVAVAALIVIIGAVSLTSLDVVSADELPTFSSCNAIVDSFQSRQSGYKGVGIANDLAIAESAAPLAAGDSYSQTNVQVAGIDEADIVKTDGSFIYTLSGTYLVIADADPLTVLSESKLELIYPEQLFIEGNRLLVLGMKTREIEPLPGEPIAKPLLDDMDVISEPRYYPYTISELVAQIYDITDKANPTLVREIDLEGSLTAARKIGSDIYLVSTSYPLYYALEERIVPEFRDTAVSEDYDIVAPCSEIRYLPPVQANSFITVSSFSMTDETPVETQTIVGTAESVYMSYNKLYVAQSYWPQPTLGALVPNIDVLPNSETMTNVYVFSIAGGISYDGLLTVPGRVLNQFSMDEYNNVFRIATTRQSNMRNVDVREPQQTNGIYIFDATTRTQLGALDGLAPTEQIYSVRFLGDRAYMVTFKTIDPLFVFDVADPANPKLLGQLKIPGYSGYLHPYDETHLIGVGKEAIDKGNFALFQGVKLALFDVGDVANPKELSSIEIGERGTSTPVLYDHKAFLFDKEKNLLALPIELYENAGGPSGYGEFTYQGLYVYRLTLENGFELLGTISHSDFVKGALSPWEHADRFVERSISIGNVLYSISPTMIKANQLFELEEAGGISFGEPNSYPCLGCGGIEPAFI